MTVSFINVPPIYYPAPPAKRRWNKLKLRTCLHGGGVPQIGEVTCGGSPKLSYKRDPIKMRDYMKRRVTPPKRFTHINRLSIWYSLVT